ncbi:MAG: lysophospholipid acyltransferase family protein [Calditrichia bacterium]
MRVKVERNGDLPANFPFVALLNHQSVFDPFIVLAFLDQRIAFLTKSTSFAHLIVRLALWLGRGIPTTRYQTDPRVIRHMRTFLERGIPLGIFPEGERTWNGELGEFKYSVVRLLVKFRIPVVPIIIFNSFSLMPRWAGFPRRQQIELTVAAPFCLVPKIFPCSELKLFLESRFCEK